MYDCKVGKQLSLEAKLSMPSPWQLCNILQAKTVQNCWYCGVLFMTASLPSNTWHEIKCNIQSAREKANFRQNVANIILCRSLTTPSCELVCCIFLISPKRIKDTPFWFLGWHVCWCHCCIKGFHKWNGIHASVNWFGGRKQWWTLRGVCRPTNNNQSPATHDQISTPVRLSAKGVPQ